MPNMSAFLRGDRGCPQTLVAQVRELERSSLDLLAAHGR